MSGLQLTDIRCYQFYKKHRLAILASTAATAYASYKAYQALADENGVYRRLRRTITKYIIAIELMGDTASTVTRDLKDFLSSDLEDVPQSIRQLNRILCSNELQDTLSLSVSSFFRGASESFCTQILKNPELCQVLDKMFETVLTDRGRGIVGVAIEIATRSSTRTICEYIDKVMTQHISLSSSSSKSRATGTLPSASSSSPSSGASEVEEPELPETVNGAQSAIQILLDALVSERGEKALSLILTRSIKVAATALAELSSAYNINGGPANGGSGVSQFPGLLTAAVESVLVTLSKPAHKETVAEILSRVTSAFCRELLAAYQESYSGATGRLSEVAGAHLKVQGQVVATDALSSSSAIASLLTSPPQWLRDTLVMVAREREVRSLAVEVIKSASREASKGVVEGLIYGRSASSRSRGSGSFGGAAAPAALAKSGGMGFFRRGGTSSNPSSSQNGGDACGPDSVPSSRQTTMTASPATAVIIVDGSTSAVDGGTSTSATAAGVEIIPAVDDYDVHGHLKRMFRFGSHGTDVAHAGGGGFAVVQRATDLAAAALNPNSLYVAASVAVSLLMFAVSPNTLAG